MAETIIYFEGIPSTGKTTIIKSLLRVFPFATVLDEYIDPREAEKAFLERDQSYFIRNDVAKYEAARATKQKAVFVDRGHLSTIAYNEAQRQLGLKGYLPWLLDYYKENILAPKKLPSNYVYLDVEPEVSLMRKPQLSLDGNHIWARKDGLSITRTVYTQFLDTHERSVGRLSIDTTNLSLNIVIDSVALYITRLLGEK